MTGAVGMTPSVLGSSRSEATPHPTSLAKVEAELVRLPARLPLPKLVHCNMIRHNGAGTPPVPHFNACALGG